ncbi:H-2 class II histocompatibility antigen, E-S beta chain-like [Sorex araneus]|uniref:H-2 class II histocompatibility antigen, E-S beta chain-like n=1 Tax=Sorex araneus TaxID=42254 RepID=UPI002433C97C|nr:H-2 class II histocompatibility antigen, E-S beta chain-like [Sorex araneus]
MSREKYWKVQELQGCRVGSGVSGGEGVLRLHLPGGGGDGRPSSSGFLASRKFQMPGAEEFPLTLGLLLQQAQVSFHYQIKHECHFSNGTERVRYLERYFYNREEFVRFDSDLGKFQAVTELGQQNAESWNQQKDTVEYKWAAVRRFCKHNYKVGESFTVQRRVEPLVTVFPSKTQSLQHHNLLVCSVNGFYPGHIEIRWFRNGQEEKAGVVSTGLVPNGDWTFQTQVMLESVPQSGDIYSCQVEHPSLQSPITVEWRAESEFALSKILSGIGGFVLGLLFLGVGLLVNYKSQKGHSGLQPTTNL